MTTPAQPPAAAEDEDGRLQRLYETVWRQRLYDSLNDPSIIQPPARSRLSSVLRFGLFLACFAAADHVLIWLAAQLNDYSWLPLGWFGFLAALAITAPIAIPAVRSMRQFQTPTAQRMLRADPRRPVLFLRSFALDDTLMKRMALTSRLLSLAAPSATLEERVVKILRRLGPVLAIGRPGEKLPALGAARFYVSHERWNQKVAEIASVAQLVIWASGTSEGLRWELSYLLQMSTRRRLLLWLHPNILGLNGDAREREWQKFREQFADLLPSQFPATIGEARFIYLGADDVPVAVLPDAYVIRDPDGDALRNLLYATGKLNAPWWFWRTSSKARAAAFGFAAGILAWLTAGVSLFIAGLFWADPEFPVVTVLDRIFSKELALSWVTCSFACGGVWGILFVSMQPHLAHLRVKYPVAAALFGFALGWASYAVLLFATGTSLLARGESDDAAPLMNAVLWPTLWGALWGLFITVFLRLLPAAPGRPKRPLP